ncbi:MAG: hypothetical protein LQ340_000769 [Diploschistes diacapsis]|nr:MAG: hypothetical protein LQ340_000769 [Diploschistes diacapsis]
MLPSGPRHQSSVAPSVPRQRILQLDRPLHQLASEEPINYSLFVDAITLLAWDIAWVAKTQGLDVGAKTWEDICALGKNMWNLLVAPPRPPRPRGRDAITNSSKVPPSSPSRSPSALAQGLLSPASQVAVAPPSPGQYTHNSSHSFLPSSGPDGGAEHLRGWRFANPVRIIDRIKSALLNERTGAEWEVLEKPDSEDAEEETLKTLQVTPNQHLSTGLKTAEEMGPSEEVAYEPSKSRKGWTKLKNPNADP